jgi:hypothetical protein
VTRRVRIAVALVGAATASWIGCAGDEQRARRVLDANAAGILACEQLYEESGAALAATLDAMQRGEWTSAAQQFKGEARPATDAYVECMSRERAVLAGKLAEAGIPENVAAQVSEAWWQEKSQQLEAARKTRATRAPASP